MKKVGSNSSLYSDTTKSNFFLSEKYVKITKRVHAFKGYANTYNVQTLNSFNDLKILNLQLEVSQ